MEELQLTLSPSRVDQRNAGVMLSNWRVGQTLSALVVDKMPNGNTILSLAGATFITARDLPSQPGSRVYLEVERVTPSLILKLKSEPTVQILKIGSSGILEQHLGSGLSSAKEALPALLQMMLMNSPPSDRLGKASLKPHLDLLARTILKSTFVNADSVNRSFLLAGIFTEAHWSLARSALASLSMKSTLLKLRKTLLTMYENPSLDRKGGQFLAEASVLAEQALSTITRQQLASTPDQHGNQKWCFSLPMELNDSFVALEVEIWQQKKQGDENEAEWRLRLDFDLPRLGELTVFIGLDSSGVTTELTCSETVKNQIRNRAVDLELSLLGAGFGVNAINVKSSNDAPVPPKTGLSPSLDTFA